MQHVNTLTLLILGEECLGCLIGGGGHFSSRWHHHLGGYPQINYDSEIDLIQYHIKYISVYHISTSYHIHIVSPGGNHQSSFINSDAIPPVRSIDFQAPAAFGPMAVASGWTWRPTELVVRSSCWKLCYDPCCCMAWPSIWGDKEGVLSCNKKRF